MENSTQLFGKETKQRWVDLKVELKSDSNAKEHWILATNLLNNRLETRYFLPIEKILKMKVKTGEGFAVMTLICSLIEFLQACYEGKTYQHGVQETETLYGNSGEKFKLFLELHKPFNSIFKKPVSNPSKKIKTFADDFYINVRCALLHEASTKNNWVIKTSSKLSSKSSVDVSTENYKIIYRDRFYMDIKEYCRIYLENIIENQIDRSGQSLRDNLFRKLNSLCEIDEDKFSNV